MKTLPVRLDRDRREPLGVQLSTQVRDLVVEGSHAPGDRLPSTRALAADLGVQPSPETVELAAALSLGR